MTEDNDRVPELCAMDLRPRKGSQSRVTLEPADSGVGSWAGARAPAAVRPARTCFPGTPDPLPSARPGSDSGIPVAPWVSLLRSPGLRAHPRSPSTWLQHAERSLKTGSGPSDAQCRAGSKPRPGPRTGPLLPTQRLPHRSRRTARGCRHSTPPTGRKQGAAARASARPGLTAQRSHLPAGNGTVRVLRCPVCAAGMTTGPAPPEGVVKAQQPRAHRGPFLEPRSWRALTKGAAVAVQPAAPIHALPTPARLFLNEEIPLSPSCRHSRSTVTFCLPARLSGRVARASEREGTPSRRALPSVPPLPPLTPGSAVTGTPTCPLHWTGTYGGRSWA